MATPSFQLLRPKILKSSLISPFISQLTVNISIQLSTYLLKHIQNPTSSYYPTTAIQATAISSPAWLMAAAPDRPLRRPLLRRGLNDLPKTQMGHSSAQNPPGAPPFLRAKARVLPVTCKAPCPAHPSQLPTASLTCFLPFASLSSQLQSRFLACKVFALAVFSAQNVLLSSLHGSFPHFFQDFPQRSPWSPNISGSSLPTVHIPLSCLTFSP